MGFFDIFKNGEFQDDGPFVYGCGVIWLIFSLFLLIFGGWLGVAIMVLNLLAVVSAIYESRSDQESYITSKDVKSLSGKLSSLEIEVLYLFLGINFNAHSFCRTFLLKFSDWPLMFIPLIRPPLAIIELKIL